MTKERKSSVVYWTSEWKDSGKETGINTTVTQGEATINIITLSGDSTNNIRIIQK
jgi:hypothetical protein